MRRADGRVCGPFLPVGGVGAQFADDGEGVGLGVEGVEEDGVVVAAGDGEGRRDDGEAD